MRVTGGFFVHPDGRVRTTLTHNPSSLRLSSTAPNLQTIPRGSAGGEGGWVKEMIVAPRGHLLWERDFSAIEAVLVGYFAGSARYIRAAKKGVHAFLASEMIGQPASFEWEEGRLKHHLAGVKGSHPVVYDTAKRIVHGSNYVMTPQKMWMEYPESFPTIKDAARLQEMYFGLFPEIPAWHKDLTEKVDGGRRRKGEEGESLNPWTLGVAQIQNPFGYLHRFYNVYEWERIETEEGVFEWVHKYGEDAKRLISFLPQSTAAAIIKRAMKILHYEKPWVGETMILPIHDSILGLSPEKKIQEALTVSKEVMEAPIPELPLDPTWEMGEFLSIGTEGKWGPVWGSLKKE